MRARRDDPDSDRPFFGPRGRESLLAVADDDPAWVVEVPYVLAAGSVLLVALTPDGVGPLAALIAGVGFVAVLLAPAVAAPSPTTYAVTALSTTATLGGVTWLLLQSQPIWIAATVLVGTFALLTATLYRYQRLRLGLVDEADPSLTRSTADDTDA